ncbi:MAG: hypothetical protein LBL51_04455, partial [Synergistaceae bacterium]|nr:hypothetical protein [Synergistaceae bacterium]
MSYYLFASILSKDFPSDKKVEVFSFIMFCNKINAADIKRWMEYCAPMHYDDFISAVSLSLSCVDDKMSLAYCEE